MNETTIAVLKGDRKLRSEFLEDEERGLEHYRRSVAASEEKVEALRKHIADIDEALAPTND